MDAAPEVTFEDFARIDVRVGRVLEAVPNPKARNPSYVLKIDFGPQIGIRTSSAQIVEAYSAEDLVGRLVMGVVNFPPRRVAGVKSEVLTLGVYSNGGEGPVILIAPDAHTSVQPGDRLG